MFDATPDWDVKSTVQLYLTGKAAMDLDLFVTLDMADYAWAMQWKWHARRSKNRFNPRHKVKWYATRVTTAGSADRKITIYLHKEICLRHHGLPPSPKHIIADHDNGNSLDCRGDNLHWATPRMNRENYNGFYALQLRLFLGRPSGEHRLMTFQKRRSKHVEAAA